MTNRQFPAEWANQDGILIAWPHINTDWANMLDEAQSCFIEIINAIAAFEKVIVLVPENENLPYRQFKDSEKIQSVECTTNDTWSRDFGPLFVKQNNAYVGLDYKFNGWGLKFAADRDNLITTRLFEKGLFNSEVTRENHLSFVLEGGSIESDGNGTLLTTSECLMSPNRNGSMSKAEIETELKGSFGAKRVLWLDYGYLSGDDTDCHVDTLARFCNPDTIAYVKCESGNDEHFPALSKMEEQLKGFKTPEGKSYNLVPLPMADAIYDNNNRLPATYANFLILNKAVLVPFYKNPKDEKTKNILAKAFPDRQIIGIDCRPLIKQNGSLHCVTMQLPEGTLAGNED
jgi:agmatine/peptidylarginine deiminase